MGEGGCHKNKNLAAVLEGDVGVFPLEGIRGHHLRPYGFRTSRFETVASGKGGKFEASPTTQSRRVLSGTPPYISTDASAGPTRMTAGGQRCCNAVAP